MPGADGLDLDAVADELYGLPLDEFTAARNAYVKQARQGGAKDVAASIQALGKPSAAAGLANQLVRQHRAELTPLLELGASLRAATESLSGADLRRLGQQQHHVISALVGQARALAADSGRTVNADQVRGLEETLHAALADEGAAAELMIGRLTEALHRSGLGSGGLGGDLGGDLGAGVLAAGDEIAPPPPKALRPTRSSGKTSRQAAGGAKADAGGVAAERERSQAEQAERTAQAKRDDAATELDQARSALENAEAEADHADEQWEQAKATVARLREELDRATAEQSETDRTRRRLRTMAEQARRAERAAQHRLEALS